MRKLPARYCNHPDRDFPKMVCGYPLPCPWHTVIIDASTGKIDVPETAKLDKKTLDRVKDIADALKEG